MREPRIIDQVPTFALVGALAAQAPAMLVCSMKARELGGNPGFWLAMFLAACLNSMVITIEVIYRSARADGDES